MAESAAARVAELALGLHAEPGSQRTVELIAEYACRVLPGSEAGVLLLHGGARMAVASGSSERACRAAQLEVELKQGPAGTALTEEIDVRAAGPGVDHRWPEWGPRAAALGISAVLAARLTAGDRPIGAVVAYSTAPGGYTGEAEAVAEAFCRHAAVALSTSREGEGLQRAMDSRKVIGQAQGILMERFAVDADQAFQVLLRYSQHGNVKLIAVAERIIATRRLPDQ